MLQLIRRILGRSKSSIEPFDFSRNRYRVKKKWPPNLRELTHKQQFQYERKYKRRVLRKTSNPVRYKVVGIAQWTIITSFVVYAVLFYDYASDPGNPTPGVQPFPGLRAKMWKIIGSVWTHTDDIEDREALRRRPPSDD